MDQTIEEQDKKFAAEFQEAINENDWAALASMAMFWKSRADYLFGRCVGMEEGKRLCQPLKPDGKVMPVIVPVNQ